MERFVFPAAWPTHTYAHDTFTHSSYLFPRCLRADVYSLTNGAETRERDSGRVSHCVMHRLCVHVRNYNYRAGRESRI